MKKRILISLLALSMMAGCGEAEKSGDNTSAVSDNDTVDVWIDDAKIYEKEADFLNSGYFSPGNARIAESENDPIIVEWDEERYEFVQITSYPSCYYYYLREIESQNVVEICITPTDYKTIDDVYNAFGNSKSIITTAASHEQTFDIMVTTSEYHAEENYRISFLPMSGYRASISLSGGATKDEILEYFDDFELVEVSEQ